MSVGVDVVVEDSSRGWELDSLKLVGPPFGELDSVVSELILEQRRTESPDAAEDEVEFIQLFGTVWRSVFRSQ